MIFLDTNIGVHFGKRSSPMLERKLMQAYQEGTPLVISVLTLHELELGIYRSTNPASKRVRVDMFLELTQGVIPFEAEDAVVGAEIRAGLMNSGTPIGSYDLLIAAQVLRHNALLITHNGREFSRIPGLRWEDWIES